MISARHKSSIEGFTLIELLAAIVSLVVVLAAATGFLITAVERQHSFMKGSEVESRHDELEQLLFAALKTADDFQIYSDHTAFNPEEKGPGDTQGNFLVCWKDGQQSSFEFDQKEIKYSQLADSSKQRVFLQAELANPPALFRMRVGVVEAAWNLTTQSELVPYRVYATPLALH
jgi:type II secretory pathway pseudopilin PulG